MSIKEFLYKTKNLITSAVTPAPPGPGCILPDAPAEECKKDCEACPSLEYPRSFQKIGIDTDEALWNGPKGWDVHFVIATGEDDWVRDVEEIEGSLMEACAKVGEEGARGRKLKISASNMPPPEDYFHLEDDKDKPTRLLVLPSFQLLEGIKPSMIPKVVDEFVAKGVTTTAPLDDSGSTADTPEPAVEKEGIPESKPETPQPPSASTDTSTEALPDLSTLSISPSIPAPTPCPHDYVILLCSHRRRDARCGISAPLLRKEFEKHLRPLGLYRDLTDSRPGGVGIYYINHVGGHKFAGNVIIYGKRGAWCVWYARISPVHCKAIVEWTIQKDMCIDRHLVRAGFNRETGVTSW